MSEQMRSEFEEWGRREGVALWCHHKKQEIYYCGAAQTAWLAWQASRAALCVELPVMSDYIDRYGQGENCDSYLTDLRDAIHAAGVKTK